jgi:hypothetical protein
LVLGREIRVVFDSIQPVQFHVELVVHIAVTLQVIAGLQFTYLILDADVVITIINVELLKVGFEVLWRWFADCLRHLDKVVSNIILRLVILLVSFVV